MFLVLDTVQLAVVETGIVSLTCLVVQLEQFHWLFVEVWHLLDATYVIPLDDKHVFIIRLIWSKRLLRLGHVAHCLVVYCLSCQQEAFWTLWFQGKIISCLPRNIVLIINDNVALVLVLLLAHTLTAEHHLVFPALSMVALINSSLSDGHASAFSKSCRFHHTNANG